MDPNPMTTATAYAIVDTAIGPVGVAWSKNGICRVALPERDRDCMEQRFAARLGGVAPGEPPAEIAAAIELIKRGK